MSHKPKSAQHNGRTDWEKQLRFDMAYAEKVLLDHGELSAMFVVHTEDARHVLLTPWKDDHEKAMCRQAARLWCIAHDAIALTFITEAWILSLTRAHGETDAEFEARKDAVMPRDAEDRIEVVMVVIAYRDAAGERQTLFESREIERRANGKPGGLKAFASNKSYEGLTGRMVDVLPEQAPSAVEQAAARALLERMQAP
jgi:hypothetical protein